MQAAAILSKYDADRSARLDFVEFTQLLHELREFQAAAGRATAAAGRNPAASVSVAPGGAGSGYCARGWLEARTRRRGCREGAAAAARPLPLPRVRRCCREAAAAESRWLVPGAS